MAAITNRTAMSPRHTTTLWPRAQTTSESFGPQVSKKVFFSNYSLITDLIFSLDIHRRWWRWIPTPTHSTTNITTFPCPPCPSSPPSLKMRDGGVFATIPAPTTCGDDKYQLKQWLFVVWAIDTVFSAHISSVFLLLTRFYTFIGLTYEEMGGGEEIGPKKRPSRCLGLRYGFIYLLFVFPYY